MTVGSKSIEHLPSFSRKITQEVAMRRFVPTEQIGVGGLVIGPKERAYVEQVLSSNRLSYGPFSQRFERLFADIHQVRQAIYCSSGTSALHLAVSALMEANGWKDGDEVLVPAVTFIASSNVVLHNRMRPVFVDVEPDTYNLDPAQLDRHLSSRTRAIMPVHMFGLPADMGPIMDFAQRHSLRVVEDSCETMFARYKDKPVGSFGDVGCFSTYVAHFLVTGVGGLAITDNPDLHVIMRSLMNHGRDSIYMSITDDQGKTGEALHEIVARRFRFVRVGHSWRVTELEAALGLAQLEEYQAIIARRGEIARRYIQGMEPLQDYLQLPTIPKDREHVFMLFPIVVRDADKRDLVNYLEDRMIETRDMMPLLSQPVYRQLFGDLLPRYPVAQWIDRGGFYIGCHQYLTNDQVDYIIDTVSEFVKKHARPADGRRTPPKS
jgi:dTDP-4-amino-4,6-dideoxygalactose transaminase